MPRAALPRVPCGSHPTGPVRALVSHRNISPTRLPWARQGPSLPRGFPEAGVHPFCARRGDWLLSFVYRTSSVQLQVAGLQPVLLQDRRMENVDLSSMVSTPPGPPRALRLPAGTSSTRDSSPGLFLPAEGEHGICLGRGDSSLGSIPVLWLRQRALYTLLILNAASGPA